MTNIIEVENLSKDFTIGNSRIRALPSVTFTIKQGAMTLIRGDNGCGKSTLMKVLATLIRPTSGSFRITGFSNTETKKIRENIAYIPDNLRFDYSLTPNQFWKVANVYRKSDNKANYEIYGNLMNELKLTRWRDKPLGSFSLGMKKRFMLSVWLSMKPRLLLLDEFETGIDENGRGLIEDLINLEDEMTILAISHSKAITFGKKADERQFEELKISS